MQSKVRHAYDSSLALSVPGSVAITATATSSLVDIQRITGSARGALNGALGEMGFDVVIHVVALDHTTGDETYVLSLNVYDSGGANPVTIETVTLLAANVGQTLVFSVDAVTARLMDANAAQFGIAVAIAGTTPSLQYWAFVSSEVR